MNYCALGENETFLIYAFTIINFREILNIPRFSLLNSYVSTLYLRTL